MICMHAVSLIIMCVCEGGGGTEYERFTDFAIATSCTPSCQSGIFHLRIQQGWSSAACRGQGVACAANTVLQEITSARLGRGVGARTVTGRVRWSRQLRNHRCHHHHHPHILSHLKHRGRQHSTNHHHQQQQQRHKIAFARIFSLCGPQFCERVFLGH
jgi:hypothetical protein